MTGIVGRFARRAAHTATGTEPLAWEPPSGVPEPTLAGQSGRHDHRLTNTPKVGAEKTSELDVACPVNGEAEPGGRARYCSRVEGGTEVGRRGPSTAVPKGRKVPRDQRA